MDANLTLKLNLNVRCKHECMNMNINMNMNMNFNKKYSHLIITIFGNYYSLNFWLTINKEQINFTYLCGQ
jgi:hypothetical protein